MKVPDNIRISWEFLPLAKLGQAMPFFSAAGHSGRDLFRPISRRARGHYPRTRPATSWAAVASAAAKWHP